MMESLRVLDYSSSDRNDLSRQIIEVMEDVGFLYLANVPGYCEDDLRWCVNFFFGLPESKKLEVAKKKYNPQNTNRYRGYFGVNQVGSSFKEGFEMGQSLPPEDPDIKSGFPLTEHNTWPHPDKDQDGESFDKFRNTMERYFNLLYEVAVDLMRLIAMGLGLNENYFDPIYCPKHLSTLRLINYPVHNFEIPADAYSPDDKRLLSTAQHRDSTILTLLNTFDYEGLQVQRGDNSWMDVGTKKNCLIINLGETISKMTGKKVKATIHRVLAIGRPRQSVPFFLEGGYHAMVPKTLPNPLDSESLASDHPKEDCFEYGSWLREYIQRFVEYKDFDKLEG